VPGLANRCRKCDLAVGLAPAFRRRRDHLEGNESDLGNGQAALSPALIHFLAADRGGPSCREGLGLAGIVDQDDLFFDLLTGAEVVVLGGVCRRWAGDPRQGWTVNLFRSEERRVGKEC
jgi:hypothetical protein